MNGVSRIVIRRSLSLGRVREAMTAGTVQPKPISRGTILRPESPILLRILSITNATRAIYPLSSSIERKKNIVTMIGRKLRTLPTPSKMPSMIRLCSTLLTCPAVSAASTTLVNAPIPASSSSCSHRPITLKVRKQTSPIITMNIGIAVYFPVRTLSILWLLALPLFTFGLITHSSHAFMIKSKRMSAIAAFLSSPRSFSSWITR